MHRQPYDACLFNAQARPWTCEDFCAVACAIMFPSPEHSIVETTQGMMRLLSVQQASEREVLLLNRDQMVLGGTPSDLAAQSAVERAMQRREAGGLTGETRYTFGEWRQQLLRCPLHWGANAPEHPREEVRRDFSALLPRRVHVQTQDVTGREAIVHFVMSAVLPVFERMSPELGIEFPEDLREQLLTMQDVVIYRLMKTLAGLRLLAESDSQPDDPDHVLERKLACAYFKVFFGKLSVDSLRNTSYPLIHLYSAQGLNVLADALYTPEEIALVRANHRRYLHQAGAFEPHLSGGGGGPSGFLSEPYMHTRLIRSGLQYMGDKRRWVVRLCLANGAVRSDPSRSLVMETPYVLVMRHDQTTGDWGLLLLEILSDDQGRSRCWTKDRSVASAVRTADDFDAMLRDVLGKLMHGYWRTVDDGMDEVLDHMLLYFHDWGLGPELPNAVFPNEPRVLLTTRLVSCENEVSGGMQSSSPMNSSSSSEPPSSSSSSSTSGSEENMDTEAVSSSPSTVS